MSQGDTKVGGIQGQKEGESTKEKLAWEGRGFEGGKGKVTKERGVSRM